MREIATSGSDTDPVGLVYIPRHPQDAPTLGECMGGGQQEVSDCGEEGALTASSGGGGLSSEYYQGLQTPECGKRSLSGGGAHLKILGLLIHED